MAEVEIPNPEEIEEQAHDSFTKRVALSTAIIAVALAITSVGGSNAAKEKMGAQMDASNEWAYFQAKSGREKLMDVSAELLAEIADLRKKLGHSPDELKSLDGKIDRFRKEKNRYALEKDGIQEKAKHHEHESRINLRKDGYFDVAEVLLQVAIVMASIAMLARSKPAWILSLVLAVSGALFSVNGFTLAFKVPGMEIEEKREEAKADEKHGASPAKAETGHKH